VPARESWFFCVLFDKIEGLTGLGQTFYTTLKS